MTDIVERLRSRAWEHRWHRKYREEAADEIERLRSALEAARILASDAMQQRGEPVAWLLIGTQAVEFDRQKYHEGSEWLPLYAAPQQRQPLTLDEVIDLVREADLDWHAGFSVGEEVNRYMTMIRAVEQGHGIGIKETP